MNSKVNNTIVVNNINRNFILFIILLAYVGIGSLFSISSISYYMNNYFEIFNGSLGGAILLVFFLLPSFIVISIFNYATNEDNDSLYLRFKSKKDYFKFQIMNNITISTIFYICCIVVLLILINLGDAIFDVKRTIYYDLPNILVSIILILKLYLFIIAIQVLNVFLLKLIKNRILHFTIIFSLILLIRFPSLLESLGVFRYLFPIPYIRFDFNNIYQDIIFTIIYFGISISLFYILSKKLVIKKDIGM